MVTIRPVTAGGGIEEGSYTTWAYQWHNAIVDGLDSNDSIATYVDDENEIFYAMWEDGSWKMRFGVYNLSDFSSVFQSSSASSYQGSYPYLYTNFIYSGLGNISNGGASRSHQTYFVLGRADEITMEVWRAGSKLLSRDISVDYADAYTLIAAEVSLIGKYILLVIENTSYAYEFMLYKAT